MKFDELFVKEWEGKSAAEILAAPPTAFEGLTERHLDALKVLGITTVEDLGTWKYAQRAAALLALLALGPLDK